MNKKVATKKPNDQNASELVSKLIDIHLLEEYRANVELWKHDDMLRQERDKKFLTINTILIITLTALIGINPSSSSIFPDPKMAMGISISILATIGILICFIWHFVLSRNSEYIRFRRLHLRAIEKELSTLDTFSNMHKALDNEQDILYMSLSETFVVTKTRGKFSSTATENRLPSILGTLWLVVLVLMAYFAFIH